MKPGFVAAATYGNPPIEIPPGDGHTSGRRRALAEWLASPQNPLTARVIVNRIWHHHFGRGIVATLDNFGKMGDAPTHPELLDWLAVEFMNRGWSIKQMHRLIMTSDAYQMASAFEHAANRDKDPENQYLWRFRAQRLDAEVVRDSILAASGGINLADRRSARLSAAAERAADARRTTASGRHKPDGPEVWRRSVYVYRKRGLAFPMFQVFDLPDQNVTSAARNVSTVPTQALTLLNDEFVLRQAELFADRVKKEAGSDPAKQIDLAYRIALTRPPTETELAIALEATQRRIAQRLHARAAEPERVRVRQVGTADAQPCKTSGRDAISCSDPAAASAALALAYLLNQDSLLAGDVARSALATRRRPGSTRTRRRRRISSRAPTSVISLFMSGGVSHVDTFDPKPALTKYAGQPLDGKWRAMSSCARAIPGR